MLRKGSPPAVPTPLRKRASIATPKARRSSCRTSVIVICGIGILALLIPPAWIVNVHVKFRSSETPPVARRDLPLKSSAPRKEPKNVTLEYDDPCASAENLSDFLKKNNGRTVYSNRNPICPSAAYNHIHVAIPFYNLNEDTIGSAIQSVREQEYQRDRVTIWVYDDGSDLNGSLEATVKACNGNLYEFPIPSSNGVSWVHAHKVLNDLGMNKTNMPSLACFRSTKHLGAGGGKFWLFGLVRTIAEPNDIVVILDGDDTLRGTRALQIVNQKYLDTMSWFTYGSYEGEWSDQIRDLPLSWREGKKVFTPRKKKWVYGHPRTFKAHLMDYITPEDFSYSDGSWLIKGSDRGFVYRMLELSGPSRIGYISDKIYNYNWSNTTSTFATIREDVRLAQIYHTRKMKNSNPLNPDLHVVLLVWKRIYLLKEQMIWLQNQTGLGKRHIHLHVVNNNWMEANAVEEAVDNFKLWQIQDSAFRDLTIRNMSYPLKVSVMHITEKMDHNFARFVYVDTLRHTRPLENVVFLDDDQYWPPNFLSSLLEEHKPKGMTTWYGKTFAKNSDGIGNYWKPVQDFDELIAGKGWSANSTFKYGGTGGSILDTNLWLLESQLQRLSKDLSVWSRIDDLWSSYVLDALLGWEMRRLNPRTMPVDVGIFQERKYYRDIMSPRISNSAEKHLLGLRVPDQTSILDVGTWNDPSVDKQAMFEKLQTTFLWDIE